MFNLQDFHFYKTSQKRKNLKKTTGEINEAIQSICAMLNKNGYGTIYFGVLPNGESKGQMINESTLRDISRKIYETILNTVSLYRIEKKKGNSFIRYKII